MMHPLSGPVARVIESSAVFAMADSAVRRLSGSAASSAAGRATAAAAAWWLGMGTAARRATAGWIVLIAVGVHVGTSWWQHATPGLAWVILPGLAAAVGVLLVAASHPIRAGRAEGRR